MLWKMPLKLPSFAVFLTNALKSVDTSTVSNSPPQSQSKPQAQFVVAGASDRFACEIVFAYYPDLPSPETFEIYGTRLVSTIPDLLAKCTPDYDIVNPLLKEDESVKQCREGIWLCYIQGDVWWESNINPEFQTDDGDWIFNPDDGYPRYIPLSVAPEKTKQEKVQEMSLKEYLAKLSTGDNDA
jgi:hypothetical protein